jgi:adenine phosphoribosyltransferase
VDAERLRRAIPFVGGHADVWRLFDSAELLAEVAHTLVEPFRGTVTKVAGIESRGFILGAAAALDLGVGLVPIKKRAGLFPGEKATAVAGRDYRGEHHELRIQRAALGTEDVVLLVDDWIETGSQARAARSLVEECGAAWAGVAVVVRQLGDADGLGRVHSLVDAKELDDPN